MSDHHNNETDEELSEARERVADDTLDFEESQAEAGATDGYDENSIVTLSPKEHVRLRPGMYISSLGDGSSSEDGIYVLLKEVIDNSVDEFNQGFGKVIDVTVTETSVTVRDRGRGIPLGSVVDASSKLNTGANFGTRGNLKTAGMNGIGIKAVNFMSSEFVVQSVRDGKMKRVSYCRGDIVEESEITDTEEPNGTTVSFTPDDTLFKGYRYREEFIVPMIKNYSFLNVGLTINLNGTKYVSRNGLTDLLKEYMTNEPLYPIIHLTTDDLEVAFTHASQYGEEYYSFANGQNTVHGGTHLTALKDAISRTIKEYSGKANLEGSDIRGGIAAAISLRLEEPVFDSQAKTKLTSRDIAPDGPTIAKYIGDFIKTDLDNFLHRNKEVADAIIRKAMDNERERKSMSTVTKKAREQSRKISLYNKKLFDCRSHLNDTRGDEEKKLASSIFITEGDSAAGSITKIRNVETQAVFSLRGKPKNTYGKTKKMVYENQEFNALQVALNIEESIDGLRYNKVIIATDADVDGMHIRLLLLTYFLQFFPDLVKRGHVYILQTPLFRVRNKKTAKRGSRNADKMQEETYYCYSDEERVAAIEKLGANAEITRFKGLGEISPQEFEGFIGPDIRLDRVSLHKEDGLGEMLRFYMGKNTFERQNFIIENLVVEDDSQIS